MLITTITGAFLGFLLLLALSCWAKQLPAEGELLDRIFCTRCFALCPVGKAPTTHYVHGHLQCDACGRNIDECCSGEQTDNKTK